MRPGRQQDCSREARGSGRRNEAIRSLGMKIPRPTSMVNRVGRTGGPKSLKIAVGNMWISRPAETGA
jgi:hypothetical protein